jgi:chromosomal replication initiation ATPase DnaA
VAARFEAMWRMARETGASLNQIGRQLGGRHHTTVLHGIRAYEKNFGA